MLNKILIILLLLTGLVYADNGWSEPVLLSPPEQFTGIAPIIVNDKTGKLYAFWTTWSKNVNYRVSLDGGQSWSGIDSSSTNPSDRPIFPKVVFDNRNNLHLFYVSINCKYYYQKMINGVWSEIELFDSYVGARDYVVIDKDDNIYVFWGLQGSGSFFYKILYADGSYSEVRQVSNMLQLDISYDGNNSIFLAGSTESLITSPTNKALCITYSIEKDSIIEVADISNNLRPSQSFAIDCKKNGRKEIFTALNTGKYIDTASTWLAHYANSSWQVPEKIATKKQAKTKQLLLDGNGKPHIFELSQSSDTLFHLYQTDSGWQEEKVVYDLPGENYWVGSYKALIVGNQLFLIYDYCLTGESYRVYFTKKTIPVGIEDNGQLAMDNVQLANYPNPFNNSTKISFNLPSINVVKLEVFNAKGELVQSVFKGLLKSGSHSFNFNATSLNSGVYYCRVSTSSEVKTTKLMLLK